MAKHGKQVFHYSPDALIGEKWYNKGWMSDILMAIRDWDMEDFH